MLNKEQFAAVYFDQNKSKNVIVEAGAGTGKTTTIAERVKYLVNELLVSSSDILCICFTNKSGENLKKRIISLMGEQQTKGLFAGTFHGFCSMIMKRFSHLFVESSYTVIDSDDQTQLMNICRSEILLSLSLDDINKLEISDDFKNVVSGKSLIAIHSLSRNKSIPLHEAYDGLVGIEIDSGMVGNIELYQRMVDLYESKKMVRKYIDFDDLLLTVIKLAECDPLFKRTLAERYKHLLVDEFQDTNPLQMRLIKILVSGRTKGFFVGDPAQTIFSFRGSNNDYICSPSLFFNDVSVLRLSENYRSNQGILNFANEILNKSTVNQYNSALFSSIKNDDAKPEVYDFYDETTEANWIVEKILDHSSRGTPLGEIMVLVRTGFSGKLIEQHLIKERIPYEFIGGTSLMKTAHVRDLISLIRVVMNIRDDVAWSRCLQLFKGVGEKKASKLISEISSADDYDGVLSVLHRGLKSETDFNLYFEGASYVIESAHEVIKRAVQLASSIVVKKYPTSKYRVKELELIAEFSKKYKSVSQFIEDFTLDPKTVTDLQEAKGDKLKLITIHAAKGMEADICFIPKANPLNYPHSRALGDRLDEEEERRVLFVAASRARYKLYLSRTLRADEMNRAQSLCEETAYILNGDFGSLCLASF